MDGLVVKIAEAGPSWLVHGFPRSGKEAASLQKALDVMGTPLSSLLVLTCSEESGVRELMDRMRFVPDKDGELVEDADFDQEEVSTKHTHKHTHEMGASWSTQTLPSGVRGANTREKAHARKLSPGCSSLRVA